MAVLLAAVAVCYSLQPREPHFQGRARSLWLEDLEESKPVETQERAKTVLTQAAEKAAPTFVQTLRAKDSKFKLMVIDWTGRQNILRLRFKTADMRREEAVREFSQFSVGAIPVLTNLFDDPQLAVHAASALFGSGPQAGVHLTRVLGHTNALLRDRAALVLGIVYLNYAQPKHLVSIPGWQGSFPTNETVTALVKCLSDESQKVRATAAFDLGNMRAQPENVIPALIENLGMTNPPQVRRALAEALGHYGQQAFQAIPALEKLLRDADPEVRTAAEKALRIINTQKQPDGMEQNK